MLYLYIDLNESLAPEKKNFLTMPISGLFGDSFKVYHDARCTNTSDILHMVI